MKIHVMLCSSYDHESNGRTKIIKLDPLNILNLEILLIIIITIEI
jgi:hypothetical protein